MIGLQTRALLWVVALLATVSCASSLNAQLLSTFRDSVLVPLANNQPFPQGLFQTAPPHPFSGTTFGGLTSLATAFQQSIEVQSFNQVNIGGLNVFAVHNVTETGSIGIYTEPMEGVFDTLDPIVTTSMAIGAPTGANPLPAVWQLNLIDADGNPGNGATPFINDFLSEAPIGEPIAVFQSPGPIPVSIVSPMGEIIATNSMIGFQFTGVNPMSPLSIDNMFGIYLGDWTQLEMDVDGMMSPFLTEWMNMPIIRWKAHMPGGGLVPVVVGMGPAALWHGPFVPEPSTGLMTWIVAIAGLGVIRQRRK